MATVARAIAWSFGLGLLLVACANDGRFPKECQFQRMQPVSSSESCGAGGFLYTDDGLGDGLCYTCCDTDFDCRTEKTGQTCELLGLFHGGDTSCEATVRVCLLPEQPRCLR